MKIKKIETKNLSKKISKKEIIKDASFEIYKGDICVFLGPNGAGKTTIIRLLTGLISPTGGEIYINGINISEDREKALANIGAIVEAPIFFNYLSGRKNLDNLAFQLRMIIIRSYLFHLY